MADSKKNIQDELRDIASDAARKYFVLADVVADSITTDDVKAWARMPLSEAPIAMHMVSKFTEAQIKSNARQSEDRALLNVNIGFMLPERSKMADMDVIDVEEAKPELVAVEPATPTAKESP